MVELSFEALRKIQVQERTFGALSNLEADFYLQYSGWVLQQKHSLQQSFSIEALKTYENAKKVITEIGAKREQKILLKALKDLRGGSVTTDGLSSEEKTLYLQVISSLKSFESAMHAEQPSQIEKETSVMVLEAVEKPRLEATRVQLLQDLSEFVATDGATLGPFNSGQVVELHREVADILVKRNAAKMVEGDTSTTSKPSSSGIIELPENTSLSSSSANSDSKPSPKSDSPREMDEVEYMG